MKATDFKLKTVHRTLMFGAPKSGKTAAALKLAEHYNVLVISVENGLSVMLNPEIGLTQTALEHIEVVDIPDTKEFPVGAETCYKLVAWKPMKICDTHGKVNCVVCSKISEATYTEIDFSKMDDSWVIVIDSLTQLSTSVMAMIMKARGGGGFDDKASFNDYGQQGAWLDHWLTAIQNCQFNVVVISHEKGIEGEDGKERLTAVGGTSNFSRTLPRYFDHVVYTELVNKKHQMGSSTSYKMNVATGSRTGAQTEKATTDNPLLAIYKEYRNYKKVEVS